MKGNASPFPMEMWYFTVTEDRETKLKLCALKYRRKYKNPEPGCGGQESGNFWPPALGSIFFQPLANTTNCCYINEERYLSVRYHCLEIIQGQLEGTWGGDTFYKHVLISLRHFRIHLGFLAFDSTLFLQNLVCILEEDLCFPLLFYIVD